MKNIRYLLLLLAFQANAQIDSLDIMIGQMIQVGFHGKSVADHPTLLDDIEKGLIGGVILYEKNIDAKQPWIKLKREISTMQAGASIPLWISIDQEGGLVNRLKPKYGFPPSVSAQYLGSVNSIDSTRFYAELTAATLHGLGINVNFAPTVDLAINKKNPIIAGKQRSYSDNADIVARHAAEVVDVHREFGIVTSLKHFPGHGSSTSDTHLGMVDVTTVWQQVETKPYQLMIKEGKVDAIMSAHIINNSLDSDGLPATLSRSVLNDLLRVKIGYTGVIFSDDMHMRAITDHYGLEKALELGINAGLDALLFSNNISNDNNSEAARIHGMIKQLVKEGKISEMRIRESYRRIMRLKSSYLAP